MNKAETGAILSLLRLEYPLAYKDYTPDDVKAKVNSWTLQFADETYEDVYAAVQMLISTRTVGYPPLVGEIREKLATIRNTAPLSEQDAWGMVSKACQNGYYGYKKEYDKLPEAVQRAVGRPEQLREWAVVDCETFQTVIASNFIKSYRAVKVREEEQQKLPSALKAQISGIADRFKLGEGRNDK